MIISVSALAGSGKDVVGSMFVNKLGFTRVAFADTLKEVCSKVLQLPTTYFHETTLKDKDFDIPFLFNKDLAANLAFELNEFGIEVTPSRFMEYENTTITSPRHALTFIGTDLCRNLVDANIWIDITLNKIKSIDGHVIVTDTRFNSERAALKALGAILMYLDRPIISNAFKRELAHQSELEQLNDRYDLVVINDTTKIALESDLQMWYSCRKQYI
jgi:hypothetical protein